MAEPNDIADSGKSTTPQFNIEPPVVASPPLSPAEKLTEPVLDAQLRKPEPAAPIDHAASAPKPLPKAPRLVMPQLKFAEMKLPPLPSMKLGLSRRARRRAVMAATVLLAAGFGAAVGAIANRSPQQPSARPDTALLEENHALQRSVAKLAKDLTALKTTVESSARDGRTQLARLGERIERAERAPDVTAAIGKAATAPASTPPAQPPVIDKPEVIASPPLPTPRPAIVQGWILREARSGQALVETRGELFQVVPGVPLPGLGRVEAIRREGDSWVVVTPKGLIAPGESSAAIPQRPIYPPYYRRY